VRPPGQSGIVTYISPPLSGGGSCRTPSLSYSHVLVVLRSYVLQGVTLPGSGVGQVDVATGAVTGLPIKMAVMVLAIVPILIVYPFVQRHFTKGVLTGAIKG